MWKTLLAEGYVMAIASFLGALVKLTMTLANLRPAVDLFRPLVPYLPLLSAMLVYFILVRDQRASSLLRGWKLTRTTSLYAVLLALPLLVALLAFFRGLTLPLVADASVVPYVLAGITLALGLWLVVRFRRLALIHSSDISPVDRYGTARLR
jgi:hypothetical protein